PKPDRTVHWIGSGIIAVILVCLAPLRSASAAASGAVTAPSDEYRVQIDGREIPTEAFRDVNLATFSFSAPVEVAIRVPAGINGYNVSPHAAGIVATTQGSTLSFRLDRPRQLVITINQGKKLFLFA